MDDTPLAQDIERLVIAAQRPIDVDDSKLLVLQDGQKIEDLSRFLPTPLRKKAHPHFFQCDSFLRYVNEHKEEATRIYVPNALTVLAVIDHNGVKDEEPGWGEHRATYAMQHSQEWLAWTGKNSVKMTQKEFCEFVEDNAKDFADRTNMLELVRTLQVNSNVVFNSWEKGDSGSVSLNFTKVIQAQAGAKGEVELPQTFTIAIPCFHGGVLLPITAKLRFEICESDKKLKLWFELQKVQQMLAEHTKQVVIQVAQSTGIEPFYGTP